MPVVGKKMSRLYQLCCVHSSPAWFTLLSMRTVLADVHARCFPSHLWECISASTASQHIMSCHLQILEETLHASERQREHDLKQQETILAAAAAEHAAQERQSRLEALNEVGHPSYPCTSCARIPAAVSESAEGAFLAHPTSASSECAYNRGIEGVYPVSLCRCASM